MFLRNVECTLPVHHGISVWEGEEIELAFAVQSNLPDEFVFQHDNQFFMGDPFFMVMYHYLKTVIDKNLYGVCMHF
ncbi:hypothetical protein [Lysinibacillus sp. SGAir0095]|uniref:hypothetical protein n=1 Tax=Lysinibacillus sp. SGAir0095 TaxID=2070463 RepID=UPI0010CD0088|nr:hypothetical protein [Lysinibacillus sp. SGAir0095]QCR30850.1 hypothetical protein C1N55_00990 [Lysinibacillus sp. SGAir0095]